MSDFHQGRVECVVGCMFCHRKGQPILMADGRILPIEDIKEGDTVQGPEGPVLVQATHTGIGQMVEIQPGRKRQPFVVTLDHELTLMDTISKIRGKPCERGGRIVDVSVRDWLSWSKHRQGIFKLFQKAVTSFETPGLQPDDLDPYFLGLLLGDGTIKEMVGITSADPEIQAEVEKQSLLYKLHVSVDICNERCPTYHLSGIKGRQNPIANKLRDLGLYGTTCASKFIPPRYKTASWEHRRELLAGLMDTDGHVTNRSGFDYISKSKQLAEDVAFVARSLGLCARVHSKENRCQTGGGGTYYRVYLGGDAALIPTRLPRKQIPRVVKHRPTLTTFSVKLLPEPEPFFGITVTGGRYLMGDFLVTHNSGKSEELLKRLRRAKIAKHLIQVFKPDIDTRGGTNLRVLSHHKSEMPATPIPRHNSLSILELVTPETKVVGLDEAQFFDPAILEVCETLASRGVRVIVAALDTDYTGTPFGTIPALMAVSEKVDKLTAVCTVCGSAATRTQRLVSIDSSDRVDIGGMDKYAARCRLHFTIPDNNGSENP